MAPREVLRSKTWSKRRLPKRILAIRLQAFGDTVITYPWLLSLHEELPGVEIDFLTLRRNDELPRNLNLFHRVYALDGPTAKWQFILSNVLLIRLLVRRYDAVIDLQRNRISRWIRFWLFPAAWSEIERFSKTSAGEKFQAGINAIGLASVKLSTFHIIKTQTGRSILEKEGWNGADNLVVLNPAGAFETRHWPIDRYVAFAHAWLLRKPNSKFLFLGIGKIAEKARFLSVALGSANSINLVNKLSPSESFEVLRHAHFILTEDSGLMHMAWIQGVPTLALFGSSPSYWSGPMGSWSRCLSSSDLPCGNCLSETCRFGDVHCLTRYSPDQVLNEVLKLLESTSR
jgi:heptosyltransferase II